MTARAFAFLALAGILLSSPTFAVTDGSLAPAAADAAERVRIFGTVFNPILDVGGQDAWVAYAEGDDVAAQGYLKWTDVGPSDHYYEQLIAVREIVRLPDERKIWCIAGTTADPTSLNIWLLHDRDEGDQLAFGNDFDGSGCDIYVRAMDSGWSFPQGGYEGIGDFIVHSA